MIDMYSKVKKNSTETKAGWILLPEQMNALMKKPYVYNASAGSYLELLFLQKFWVWLSQFISKNVAPCVLTCIGLGINLASCLTLLYFSPDARTEAPSWVYLVCAMGVFLYQTLDALDGKQAAKVQDSPIEELYDHGCDSVSTVFVLLTTAAACQFGNTPLLMFTFFTASMLAFYTTHWQDHVTHQMVFGKIDVSEAQFFVMFIHVLTAKFGTQLWKAEVLSIELRMFVGAVIILSLCATILANVEYVLGKKTPLDNYVKIPRKTSFQIWNPLVPVTALTLCVVKAYSSGLFISNPCIFIVAFGLAYAKLTMKLVITNVTYSDMDFWDTSLVAPFLLCLNTYLPTAYVLPPYTALLCGLVYNLMDVARYFTYVSWDLREALDAWIFSIKYEPGHPKSRKGNQGFYINGLNNTEVLASSPRVL